MQLQKIIKISGIIHLITGLHIGAGKDNIEIGGLDLPIMKNPYTKAPYIPGSSIKGKMRSMLEVTQLGIAQDKSSTDKKPVINKEGQPCGCGECLVCTVFGAHSSDQMAPTRLLVRDASMTPFFQTKFNDGALAMEVKYENIINRVKGIAEHPRPVERVPAGVEFDFSMSLKVYEGDDEAQLVELIKSGLQLIELDALGGHSSRGSGQVKFKDLQCVDNNGKEISFTL